MKNQTVVYISPEEDTQTQKKSMLLQLVVWLVLCYNFLIPNCTTSAVLPLAGSSYI